MKEGQLEVEKEGGRRQEADELEEESGGLASDDEMHVSSGSVWVDDRIDSGKSYGFDAFWRAEDEREVGREEERTSQLELVSLPSLCFLSSRSQNPLTEHGDLTSSAHRRVQAKKESASASKREGKEKRKALSPSSFPELQ